MITRERPRVGQREWLKGPVSFDLMAMFATCTDVCDRANEICEAPMGRRDDAWSERFRIIVQDLLLEYQCTKHWTDSRLKQLRPQSRPKVHSLNRTSLSASFDFAGKVYQESVDLFSNAPLYPPIYYIYKSHSIAVRWSTIHSVRLNIMRELLDLSVLLSEHGLERPPELASHIELYSKFQDITLEICASAPYLLGEVDDNGNLIPPATAGERRKTPFKMQGGLLLYAVGRKPYIGAGAKRYIRSVLYHLGTVGGVRNALELMNHYMNLESLA